MVSLLEVTVLILYYPVNTCIRNHSQPLPQNKYQECMQHMNHLFLSLSLPCSPKRREQQNLTITAQCNLNKTNSLPSYKQIFCFLRLQKDKEKTCAYSLNVSNHKYHFRKSIFAVTCSTALIYSTE